MIRAGERGYQFEEFARGYVAIGWKDIGDLTRLNTKEQIRERYLQIYPRTKPNRLGNHVAVICKFRSKVQLEDGVITYDPINREYLVGKSTGEHTYDLNAMEDNPHLRTVDWIGRINRNDLTVHTQNILCSLLTLVIS